MDDHINGNNITDSRINEFPVRIHDWEIKVLNSDMSEKEQLEFIDSMCKLFVTTIDDNGYNLLAEQLVSNFHKLGITNKHQ